MMLNDSNIDEIFTEWEDRINFLTDHIEELEAQILYYQNLVAEKDLIINQLKAECISLKGQNQVQVIQKPIQNNYYPSNFIPPPQVQVPSSNLSPPPDVKIQESKSIDSLPPIKNTRLSLQNNSEDDSIRKRQCPQCGAFGFAIKEMDDKTRILCYEPIKIYAKKRVCIKCRYEF